MNKKINTRNLVIASLLVALSVVFSRMFSLRISDGLRLSFGQTPIILSGIILGPIWGFVVGALADVTGFILKPMGAYLPGLTLCSGLAGAIPGFIRTKLIKNKQNAAIILSVAIVCLVVNGIFSTFFLSIAYSSRGFMGWLAVRMPVEIIMTFVQSAVVIAITAGVSKVLEKKPSI